MKKIISLFQRNYEGDKLVRNEVVPGAEWVLAGEGVATRKFDGTCCMIRGGKLFKRYESKPGIKPPPNFEPADDTDELTGKRQGWLPIGDGPEDKWHREAFAHGVALLAPPVLKLFPMPNIVPPLDLTTASEEHTYELCGPKVQGNPEKLTEHFLFVHGLCTVECPRDFDGIKAFLVTAGIEGIVWHHPDGRMVKIKRKDFFRSKP